MSYFVSTVGPFGVVDLLYVLPPPSLLSFYAGAIGSLKTLVLTSNTAEKALGSVHVPPTYSLVPTEIVRNANLTLCGGNLLCGNDVSPWPAANGMYVGFSVTNMCHTVFTSYVVVSVISELFVLLGLNFTQSFDLADVPATCELDVLQPSACTLDRAYALSTLASFATHFEPLAPMAVVAHADVRRLNIVSIQYVFDAADNTTTQRTYPVPDESDPGWSFYGWHYLYEWVTGLREVVSFVGDHGQITAMSASTLARAMVPDANTIPLSFSFLIKYSVQYITTVLIGVCMLLGFSAVYHKGHVEARNFLCVNRIVGMTWLGRPLVLVRSLSAIWLLNTSPLTLVQVGVGTRFTSPPLAWYTTFLATSEMTWFVYVLNDLFSCITQQYTSLYASKSSTLTWLVAFAWTLWSPQLYAASVDRHCSVQDMDFQLTCRSGTVAVGSLSRFGVSVAVICGCVGAMYLVQRWWHPSWPPLELSSVLLNAQSYYLIRLHPVLGDKCLDRTSAIMAGVISVMHKDTLYLLDVKSWRMWREKVPMDVARRRSHVLPRLE
ncbi:hypothetical protein ACHHYP_11597 [Achlya hypogyna]|uniref:Transmembrane protein n=1 Tax=Achlya hypogyna TaxID=1202772 RepID=A0A1V9YIT4_ACHHY|nr:hypothetical protein ACHHYP_11597 [Achlya hypogyna]